MRAAARPRSRATNARTRAGGPVWRRETRLPSRGTAGAGSARPLAFRGMPAETDPLAELARLTPSAADQARIDTLRAALLRLQSSGGGLAGNLSLSI